MPLSDYPQRALTLSTLRVILVFLIMISTMRLFHLLSLPAAAPSLFSTVLAQETIVDPDQQGPGWPFPVSDPTTSYWQLPSHPNISNHQSESLPASVDILIIGSGISGASVAWHLLLDNNSTDSKNVVSTPRIAMIDARAACSGATGRNGGHIRPASYSEHEAAKLAANGNVEDARKATVLRAAHVDALIAAAAQLPEHARAAAKVRSVDSLDVFFTKEEFELAKEQLEVLKKEVPEVGQEWGVLEVDEARRISLMPDTVGVLTGTAKVAGAIWPYRFVTGALQMLLGRFAENFSLDTHTLAKEVRKVEGGYEVATDRGVIQTKHVVYASNAWTPHFVKGLNGFMKTWVLHMSAQLGGAGLPRAGEWPAYHDNISLPGGRAWSLMRQGLDYAVEMPGREEYMFGGASNLIRPLEGLNVAVNLYDDHVKPDHQIASYLDGALASYFGYENWGAERTDFPGDGGLVPEGVYVGRTKGVWNGIEGRTLDEQPVVGPLTEALTGRKAGVDSREWVTAGFNGEGMAYAWLSGKALAEMIRSSQSVVNETVVVDWFPKVFLPTEQRITKAIKGKTVLERSLERHRRNSRMGPW